MNDTSRNLANVIEHYSMLCAVLGAEDAHVNKLWIQITCKDKFVDNYNISSTL